MMRPPTCVDARKPNGRKEQVGIFPTLSSLKIFFRRILTKGARKWQVKIYRKKTQLNAEQYHI